MNESTCFSKTFSVIDKNHVVVGFIFHFPRKKNPKKSNYWPSQWKKNWKKKYGNESGRFSLWREETSILSAFIPTPNTELLLPSQYLSLASFLFNTTFVFVPLDKNIKRTSFIPPSEMPPACGRGRWVEGGKERRSFVGFFSHVANSKTTEYVMKSHPSTCQNLVI